MLGSTAAKQSGGDATANNNWMGTQGDGTGSNHYTPQYGASPVVYNNTPQYVSSPGLHPVEYATSPHTVSVSKPLPTMPTYSPGVTYLAQARPVSVSTPQYLLPRTSPLQTAPPYSPSGTYFAQQAPTVIAGATHQMTMAPTFTKPEIGFSFSCARDKHPVIDEVDLGSPADSAGLLKGDRLLSVSATTAISTAKTEVKGLDAQALEALLTQTFDAASRGANMLVQVERGQGAGVNVLEKVLKKVEKVPWPHGIGLSFNCFTGQAPLIAKVDPGSHAHDAGLLMGDRLLSVSATTAISTIRTEVEGFDAEQLVGLLRQTFHAASQCGGKMGFEVERVQNGAVKVLKKVFEKMGNAPLQYVPSPQAPLQYATSPKLVSYAPLQYATSPTLVPTPAGPSTVGLDVDCNPGQQPTIAHVLRGIPAHNHMAPMQGPNHMAPMQVLEPPQYVTSPQLVQSGPNHMSSMQVLQPPQYVTSSQRVQSGPNHMSSMQILEPPQYMTSPQLVQSGPNHMSSMQVLEPPQYVTSPQRVQSGPNHMSSMQVLGPIAWDNAPGFDPMTPAPATFEPLREMPVPGLHITRVA